MRRTRTAGIGLIEMLATLLLIVAFSLISARLFTNTLRQLRAVPQAGNEIAAIEQIRAMMTTDVWNAADLRQPSEEQILVLDSQGQLITWQRLSDDTISRSQNGIVNHWINATKLQFSISEAGVLMRQKDRTWLFASPLRINGSRP